MPMMAITTSNSTSVNCAANPDSAAPHHAFCSSSDDPTSSHRPRTPMRGARLSADRPLPYASPAGLATRTTSASRMPNSRKCTPTLQTSWNGTNSTCVLRRVVPRGEVFPAADEKSTAGDLPTFRSWRVLGRAPDHWCDGVRRASRGTPFAPRGVNANSRWMESDPNLANKLDLYLPKGKQGFPILVFVHGGGYQKGDRKEGQTLGQVFAARGVGAAVISYRLYP